MTPRPPHQVKTEEFICGLSHILSMPPSSLPHQDHTWGSDSSMIPATSGIGDNESVTAAITKPQTIVMCLSRQNVCDLHGKLVGLIMGLVLSINNSQNNKLSTDHLNSVCFIDDTKTSINQENHLRDMNGCLYYRWIMNLARRVWTEVIHTKAHTNQVTMKLITMLLNHRILWIAYILHLSPYSSWTNTHFISIMTGGLNQTYGGYQIVNKYLIAPICEQWQGYQRGWVGHENVLILLEAGGHVAPGISHSRKFSMHNTDTCPAISQLWDLHWDLALCISCVSSIFWAISQTEEHVQCLKWSWSYIAPELNDNMMHNTFQIHECTLNIWSIPEHSNR